MSEAPRTSTVITAAATAAAAEDRSGIVIAQWSKVMASDSALAVVGPTNTDCLASMGGGFPFVTDDDVIGAISVSGGHCGHDVCIAGAGLTGLNRPQTVRGTRKDF